MKVKEITKTILSAALVLLLFGLFLVSLLQAIFEISILPILVTQLVAGIGFWIILEGSNNEVYMIVILRNIWQFLTGKAEPSQASLITSGAEDSWRSLAEFTLPSEPGNETQAMQRILEAVQELHLSETCIDRLKTAVAEATMNAIEHGHQNRPELLVQIQVMASDTALVVRVTDEGGGRPIPEPAIPDLKAKLAGLQPARGWGLFLIKNLMDELHVTQDETHHTLELVMYT